MYTTVNCLEYDVFTDELGVIELDKGILVSTINQYSYCVAEEDADFKKVLQNSDILLPDGVGIVAASKLLNGQKINKIAGADIHDFLLKKLDEIGGSCFYLGASEATLEKIKKRLSVEYGNIRMGSYSPPYKPSFTDADNEKMLTEVNNFKPDVLFVGMTAPKQEKWAYAHKKKLNAGVICSIGAVFDFYAGTVERPSKIWIDLGMEWLGRLIKEPRRMWKRYIYYGAVFGYDLILRKTRLTFGIKLNKNSGPH